MCYTKIINAVRNNWSIILKYAGSGALAILLDYLVFFLLNSVLGVFYLYAVTFSYFSGLLLNFYLNKILTFRKKENTLSQLVKYFILAGANFLMTLLLMYLFISLLRLNPLVSRGVVIVIVSSWNFLLYKYVVYK